VWGCVCVLFYYNLVQVLMLKHLKNGKGRPLHANSGAVPISSPPTALEGVKWLAARLGRTYPWDDPRYPLYRRLDGPQGRLDAEVRGKFLRFRRGSKPGRPVRSQSLYWLSYPALLKHLGIWKTNSLELYELQWSLNYSCFSKSLYRTCQECLWSDTCCSICDYYKYYDCCRMFRQGVTRHITYWIWTHTICCSRI
jgi:hypothetical protein